MRADSDDERFLIDIQREAWEYFRCEANERTGLIIDQTRDGAPASISAVGLALSCYPIGVERGYFTRAAAAKRTLATLRFFRDSAQSPTTDATGWKGFYYHFLNMHTGRRARQCELSTIDTAMLMAGALLAAVYFDRGTAAESEIRQEADALYRRVDWRWALNDAACVSHGWTPESGFLPHSWTGYSEALLLYALALGSPTHAARHFHHLKLRKGNPYGFKATFNATIPHDRDEAGWVSPAHFALNEGPMVLMIENHLSGLIWTLMRRCPYIERGLRRAGFSGGWLG